jgi:hypothetical protein
MSEQCYTDQYFVNQAAFIIRLDTKRDLTGVSVQQIKYRKPISGTKGYWEATINGTVLEYDVQTGDIDETGTWQLETYIEIDGRPGFGGIVHKEFECHL